MAWHLGSISPSSGPRKTAQSPDTPVIVLDLLMSASLSGMEGRALPSRPRRSSLSSLPLSLLPFSSLSFSLLPSSGGKGRSSFLREGPFSLHGEREVGGGVRRWRGRGALTLGGVRWSRGTLGTPGGGEREGRRQGASGGGPSLRRWSPGGRCGGGGLAPRRRSGGGPRGLLRGLRGPGLLPLGPGPPGDRRSNLSCFQSPGGAGEPERAR